MATATCQAAPTFTVSRSCCYPSSIRRLYSRHGNVLNALRSLTLLNNSPIERLFTHLYVAHPCHPRRSYGIRTMHCSITIQYKFINMAAISWIKRKTITHKDTHSKLHYWKLVKENGIKDIQTDKHSLFLALSPARRPDDVLT